VGERGQGRGRWERKGVGTAGAVRGTSRKKIEKKREEKGSKKERKEG
jgi:hypothetical protein